MKRLQPEKSSFRVFQNNVLFAGVLAVVPVTMAAGPKPASTQQHTPPLVYRAENTGPKISGTVFPDFGHLPIVRPLPDALRLHNGGRVASHFFWEQRRAEIRAAIEKYEIGPKPDCSDCTITARYVPPASGSGDWGKLTVVVTRRGKSLTLASNVFLPPGVGSGPLPVLIPMTFGMFAPKQPGPNYGALPAAAFADGPVMTIDFVHDQVAAYTRKMSSHADDPFYQLYPELCAGICPGGVSNSGEYAAWSWGVSRLIDGMRLASQQKENPLPVDMAHIAVTGCSYAGKMALFAGAFDERIALTISQENGGGGAASWRVSQEIEADGSAEKIDNTSYEWFAGQMKQFSGNNVYKLPEDHDELMDLVAPRALLETGNTDYHWLSNQSNYVAARATERVFDTLGVGDRFGFFIDGSHPHCRTLPSELPALQTFVDRFLLGKEGAKTEVRVSPFASLDAERWTAWWGKPVQGGEPSFPNNWTGVESTVLSLGTQHAALRLAAGQHLSAGYQVRMTAEHPAATVTLTGADI